MLEKLLKQFPNVCGQKSCEGLWENIFFFLLHQHVWVRKVSSRLLDVYFAACCAAENNGMEAGAFGGSGQQGFLLQRSRLTLLAAVLCQQLNSELDEGLAALLEKNLLFVSLTLNSAFFDGKDQLSWLELVSEKDAATRARVVNALGILKVHQWIFKEGEKPGRIADAPTNRNKGVKSVDESIIREARYYGLYPVLKYLERVSVQANDLQMKTVFHLYESFLMNLGRDGVRPYLSAMLLPLYRAVEAVAAKIISDDVKNVAESVLDRIRETVGTEEFVQAYNETREMTKDVRDTRRQAKKLKVLVDPEGNARRKLKLNLKRQVQKKNKKKKSWQEHGK